MDTMENEIIVEEMERQSVCKPDCESWSYQVARASHYTEKGKSKSVLSQSVFLVIVMSFGETNSLMENGVLS